MFYLMVIKKNPPDTFEINYIAIVFGIHVVQNKHSLILWLSLVNSMSLE